ncbi:alpha/beta hydrolase [Roseovarius sp. C03]|uniref:alpha/beta hydrolase n=1 Tax=Roseovarius sp. C03 TaxID=3449222 RepID=UPI003EDBA95E
MPLKSLSAAAGAVALSLGGAAEAAVSKRVVFESNGERLVGDLYLPDGYQEGQELPAIVVTGAWTTVKEQMPRVYAAEMANRGFAALTFDFRGWGQSEGERRQYEHPGRKTEDILAAAAFLATRPEIDPTRIGGLGICASSGYMSDATARSAHLRSLVLVAPWLHNAEIVEATYGGSEAVSAFIAAGRDADAAFERSGEQMMAPAASATDESAIMFRAPYYTERDRGLIPEYFNEFNLASWEPWLTYDAVSIASSLGDTPVQIIHSEAAAIPQGAHAFFADLKGPKAELWLEDVSQFDFYDDAAPVTAASDAAAGHFAKSLI